MVMGGVAFLTTIPKTIEFINKKESKIFAPTQEPIALIKFKDMIYHCQGIVKTSCGHSIHCGNMTVHCVKDIQVEYLQ